MKKNKQDLIKEAAILAQKHQEKKAVIEKLFSDLDKEEVSIKHLNAISTVNEIMKEMDELEEEHAKIIEQIKS